jgi:uncharacterized membrane protein YkvA (DUF1232 family)
MRPTLRDRARALKNETLALYMACRDPRTPWYAKAFGALVIGYALSPIDLIPDFIPILGYLDDVILLPLGIALLLRMVPRHVMEDARAEARTRFAAGTRSSRTSAVVVIAVWAALILILAYAVYRAARGG